MNLNIKKILLAIVGIMFVGIGISFNNNSQLGNDPIGLFYDGIRSILSLSHDQFGLAINIVNVSLIIIMLFIGRRYINIGTLIYIVPYSFFVGVGDNLYKMIFVSDAMIVRWISVIIGCLILYTGVAIFIVVNIGLDPFTGVVMVICDKVKKEYRVVKVVFDIALIIIGYALGGKLGLITIITACVCGPLIQFLVKRISKFITFEDNK